jgi:hypothetical protein
LREPGPDCSCPWCRKHYAGGSDPLAALRPVTGDPLSERTRPGDVVALIAAVVLPVLVLTGFVAAALLR